MIPWYRKQWTGGLFGRYEAPPPNQNLICRLIQRIDTLKLEAEAYRDGWNEAIAQHDALLERYRGLSRETNLLTEWINEAFAQRDKAIRERMRAHRNSSRSDMISWLLGAGVGALAMFTVMWVFGL